MQELIDSFSLERVSKSGARFQPDKAKWFNAQYMHHKSDAELAALFQPILRDHGIEVADEVAGRAAGIMKERATFITDLWDLTSFFFTAPAEYEEKQARKYWKGQNPEILRELRGVLASIDDFSKEDVYKRQFYNTDNVELFRKNGIIAIAQDFKKRFTTIPNITGPHYSAGRMAAEYFLQKGFRNFAFYGTRGIDFSDERCQGFRETIEAANPEFTFSSLRSSAQNDLRCV